MHNPLHLKNYRVDNQRKDNLVYALIHNAEFIKEISHIFKQKTVNLNERLQLFRKCTDYLDNKDI